MGTWYPVWVWPVWPCARPTEPFPPRPGQLSCPGETERTPRQTTGWVLYWGWGAHNIPHLSYSRAKRPLLGVGQSRAPEVGLKPSVGWPPLEGRADTTPPSHGPACPSPRCAAWRELKLLARLCLRRRGLWAAMAAFAGREAHRSLESSRTFSSLHLLPGASPAPPTAWPSQPLGSPLAGGLLCPMGTLLGKGSSPIPMEVRYQGDWASGPGEHDRDGALRYARQEVVRTTFQNL